MDYYRTLDGEPLMAWGCTDEHCYVIWWDEGPQVDIRRRM